MKNVTKALLGLGLVFSVAANVAAMDTLPVTTADGRLTTAQFPTHRALRSKGLNLPATNLYAVTAKEYRAYLATTATQGQVAVATLVASNAPVEAANLQANVEVLNEAVQALDDVMSDTASTVSSDHNGYQNDGFGFDDIRPATPVNVAPNLVMVTASAPEVATPSRLTQVMDAIRQSPAVQNAVSAVQNGVAYVASLLPANPFAGWFSRK